MTEDKIQRSLFEIFSKTFDYNQPVLPELSADMVEKWTSLTHNIFILDVETFFSISFTLREVARFKNLGDMIPVIKKHLDQN